MPPKAIQFRNGWDHGNPTSTSPIFERQVNWNPERLNALPKITQQVSSRAGPGILRRENVSREAWPDNKAFVVGRAG